MRIKYNDYSVLFSVIEMSMTVYEYDDITRSIRHWLLRHTARSNNLPRVAPYDYTITVKYKAKLLNILTTYFFIYFNLKFYSVGNSKCLILWLSSSISCLN